MRRKIVAEAYGEVVGFVSVLGRCRSAAPDDAAELFAYVDDLAGKSFS
jgi:hypothetical protein